MGLPTRWMFGVAHAMGQIRQARLNILIELQFWVDKIIVSDLDWGMHLPWILRTLWAHPGRKVKTLSLSTWGEEIYILQIAGVTFI